MYVKLARMTTSRQAKEEPGYLAAGSKDAILTRLRRIEGQVRGIAGMVEDERYCCLLYTSPSPRDISGSRMPSSA